MTMMISLNFSCQKDLNLVPGSITQNSLQKMTLRCDPEYNFIFFRTLETSHPQVTESPSWFEIADLAAGPIDAQLAAWRALSEADPAAVDHLGLLQLDLLHSFLPTFRISSPMNCFLTGVVACLY